MPFVAVDPTYIPTPPSPTTMSPIEETTVIWASTGATTGMELIHT